jgi:hypothetical protein
MHKDLVNLEEKIAMLFKQNQSFFFSNEEKGKLKVLEENKKIPLEWEEGK